MIERWDLITIGNISRNRYWGESDERAYRSAICTCTLVTLQGGTRLLVDPSLLDAEAMRVEIDRRSGLKLEDISAVFITHEHGDHHFGLKHFPRARWLAAPPVATAINHSGQYTDCGRTVEAIDSRLFECIDILPTPGHTLSHHSLRFDCEGMSVLIAADAAMTRDFWRERRGYFNSADMDLAGRTIAHLATLADIVVPGHDNYFLNDRAGGV